MMDIKEIVALEEAYDVKTTAELLAGLDGCISDSTSTEDATYYSDLYNKVKSYMESK